MFSLLLASSIDHNLKSCLLVKGKDPESRQVILATGKKKANMFIVY